MSLNRCYKLLALQKVRSDLPFTHLALSLHRHLQLVACFCFRRYSVFNKQKLTFSPTLNHYTLCFLYCLFPLAEFIVHFVSVHVLLPHFMFTLCPTPCVISLFGSVRLFATPWTVAHQAPLSRGFSSREYLSGLPFPSPGDLPHPGIEP